jgi:DNA-directed RNA polymerase specialized sigma subunit
MLPDEVDIRELYRYGFQGLIRTIERFDPSRGVWFDIQATRRMKKSILSGLMIIESEEEQKKAIRVAPLHYRASRKPRMGSKN